MNIWQIFSILLLINAFTVVVFSVYSAVDYFTTKEKIRKAMRELPIFNCTEEEFRELLKKK